MGVPALLLGFGFAAEVDVEKTLACEGHEIIWSGRYWLGDEVYSERDARKMALDRLRGVAGDPRFTKTQIVMAPDGKFERKAPPG